MRAVRSLHYVPANKPEWVVSAPEDYDADGYVFDLEDSVPPDEKAVARETLRDAYDSFGETDAAITARVNAPHTEFFYDDLKAVVHEKLDAVRVPMVSSPRDVRETASILGYLESCRDIENRTEILAAIETAAGTRKTYDIATASDRVALVSTGTGPNGDLAGELGYEWTPGGMERVHLMSKLVLDGRAADVGEIHAGVWMGVDDIDGLEREARFRSQLGFTGQSVIHPSHIDPVNEIFSPAQEDIEYARRLIEAVERATDEGTSAIRFEGQMVDTAHVNSARAFLERARELGVLDERS